MKGILVIITLVVASQAEACIRLKSEVFFTADETETSVQEFVNFSITVINECDYEIPDLGVTNRSKYLKFFVDGKEDNPLSLYNGLESIKGPRVIGVGDSANFTVSWTMDDDSGIWMRGDTFQVQWQYMDQFSWPMFVNLKARKARPIIRKEEH